MMYGRRSITVVLELYLLQAVQVCTGLVSGLSYNYFDEMAHSYCAASHKYWTFTVRRDCGGEAPTCNDICSSASAQILSSISHQRKSVECFDAFNIMKQHPRLRENPSHSQPDANTLSMGSYGYGTAGCTWKPNHCGPNYCCCRAF